MQMSVWTVNVVKRNLGTSSRRSPDSLIFPACVSRFVTKLDGWLTARKTPQFTSSVVSSDILPIFRIFLTLLESQRRLENEVQSK